MGCGPFFFSSWRSCGALPLPWCCCACCRLRDLLVALVASGAALGCCEGGGVAFDLGRGGSVGRRALFFCLLTCSAGLRLAPCPPAYGGGGSAGSGCAALLGLGLRCSGCRSSSLLTYCAAGWRASPGLMALRSWTRGGWRRFGDGARLRSRRAASLFTSALLLLCSARAALVSCSGSAPPWLLLGWRSPPRLLPRLASARAAAAAAGRLGSSCLVRLRWSTGLFPCRVGLANGQYATGPPPFFPVVNPWGTAGGRWEQMRAGIQF